MSILKTALLISVVCQSVNVLTAEVKMRAYNIRHDKPAAEWASASPLGNGRLGAMVCGGVKEEVIHLNEDTFWSGEQKPHLDGKKHLAHLDQVRKLIYSGKHAEATSLGQGTMLGAYGEAFLPLGELKLDMPDIDPVKTSGYDRTLNLNNALSTTIFTHAGVRYERTVFISHPDQVMVVRLTASKANAINLNVTLDSVIKHQLKVEAASNRLWMTGRAPIHADADYMGKKIIYDMSPAHKGMRFATLIQVDQQGGESSAKNGVVSVKGASSVTIKLTAATSYNGFNKSPSAEGKDEVKLAKTALDKVVNTSVKELQLRQQKDHAALFSRVDIQLGDTAKQGKPVSQRTLANQKGDDPDLDELFYQ
ncbi:MAG: glycoside hydrolase family 95 protein, partial [Lentisphaeria bacterium]|nr:glycoside hydrolase family 95 protein [Lentisphaeria bacterium]